MKNEFPALGMFAFLSCVALGMSLMLSLGDPERFRVIFPIILAGMALHRSCQAWHRGRE